MHIQLSENDFTNMWSDAEVPLLITGDCTFDTISASVSGGGINSACSYTVNTGMGSAGSAVGCTCFQATGIGSISNCPIHPSLTVGNPNPWVITTYPNTGGFTFTTVEEKCYICRDVIEMEDVLGGYKACKDCRRAIEAFKAVLVCEEEEKEK